MICACVKDSNTVCSAVECKNRLQGGEMTTVAIGSIQAVIDRLELMPKQGEAYDHKGRHGWANPIRQDTGPLLTALALAARPANILEIGTAHGLSLCYIAKGANGAKLSTIEWDEARAKDAEQNFEDAGMHVEVINGDALKIIPTFQRRFGFVFLDANKDGYLEQIQLLIQYGLLMPGCTIVADNVIDRQTECQPFLDFMKQYPHIILQTECGLLVGRI